MIMGATVCKRRRNSLKLTVVIVGVLGVIHIAGAGAYVSAEPGMSGHLRQMNPMRQDSLKVPSLNDAEKTAPVPSLSTQPVDGAGGAGVQGISLEPVGPRSYDPSGRRDPFVPIILQLGDGKTDPTLPPLQRVGLTEMNLIAIVWGAYGYTAMVQTPDGNGYSVRRGTRVGPNSGVVSAITEKGIIVQERFTDVYGRKQEREYVKLLHPKEGAE